MSRTSLQLPPKPPQFDELVRDLIGILGRDGVMTDEAELRAYDCDAYAPEKRYPDVVVLPRTTEQVSKIVRLCNRMKIPFTPRGAGTGLSGGAYRYHGRHYHRDNAHESDFRGGHHQPEADRSGGSRERLPHESG